MRNATPTGRFRHRIAVSTQGWGYGKTTKHLLVLQIEERGFESSFSGGRVDGDFVNRWRDATVGDISVDGPAVKAPL